MDEKQIGYWVSEKGQMPEVVIKLKIEMYLKSV